MQLNLRKLKKISIVSSRHQSLRASRPDNHRLSSLLRSTNSSSNSKSRIKTIRLRHCKQSWSRRSYLKLWSQISQQLASVTTSNSIPKASCLTRAVPLVKPSTIGLSKSSKPRDKPSSFSNLETRTILQYTGLICHTQCSAVAHPSSLAISKSTPKTQHVFKWIKTSLRTQWWLRSTLMRTTTSPSARLSYIIKTWCLWVQRARHHRMTHRWQLKRSSLALERLMIGQHRHWIRRLKVEDHASKRMLCVSRLIWVHKRNRGSICWWNE